jgi:ribokinase
MAERLVVVGSANVDLIWRGERLPRPGEKVSGGTFARVMGGTGANQACAAARLGADVAFVGCIGDDDLGAAVRADLADHGVDCTWLATAPRGISTGVALITVDARGDNAIAVASGANRALTPEHVRAAVAATTDADVGLLTSLEIGLPNASAAIDAARGPVLFNPSPVDADAPKWFDRAQTVVVNEGEAVDYGIDLAALPANVVVTLGAHGARSPAAACDGFSTDVVDTTGAGDEFSAAYALTGDLAFACAAAALACRAVGPRGSQPTRDVVDALVRAQQSARRG